VSVHTNDGILLRLKDPILLVVRPLSPIRGRAREDIVRNFIHERRSALLLDSWSIKQRVFNWILPNRSCQHASRAWNDTFRPATLLLARPRNFVQVKQLIENVPGVICWRVSASVSDGLRRSGILAKEKKPATLIGRHAVKIRPVRSHCTEFPACADCEGHGGWCQTLAPLIWC
jgi:hypothetical protein